MKCSHIAIRILLSTLAASSSCSAFVTPHASSSSSSRSIQQSKSIHTTSTTTTTRTMLNAIPELMDLNVNLDHLASQYDGAMQQIIASSSHLISDASAAVATMDGDAVGTAVKEEGWWDQYLNLYKSLLLFVHTTIDTPLRSGGWDQTWGIAIASFTARKYYYLLFDCIILVLPFAIAIIRCSLFANNTSSHSINNFTISRQNGTPSTLHTANKICGIHQST